MNKEILEKLLPAAMLGSSEGMAEGFKKMSVNIDRVLRSDFVGKMNDISEKCAFADPYIINIEENRRELRCDKVEKASNCGVASSPKYEEPYIVVPRVVGE